ncbi:MAG: TlpA disulfide reductase family protein [Candidatus Solibacter sp.]
MTLLAVVAPFAPAAILPRPAPDFAITVPNGKPVRLSQYRGKTVVVAFILTYCSHCQKAIQVLAKAQQDYGPKGLQVLASATEDMAAAALPGFLRQFAPPFPVGINSTNEFVNFMQHPVMLQLYMPGIVFIDKEGVIRAQYEGRDSFLEESSVEKNMRAKIEEMLAPLARGPAEKAPAKKSSTKKSN